MNSLIIQEEERQFIYYDFIKKLNNFLYKTMLSNINQEVIKNNIRNLFVYKSKIFEDMKLKNSIIERLEFHLSESVYSKMSKIIRYILENEFHVKINAFDNFISKSFIPTINIFENEKSCNVNLEEISKEKLIMKDIGDLSSKKSIYLIDEEKTFKLIKKISNEKSRMLLLDKVLICFPDYLEINYKIINIIMNENGYLSIPTRYYIAIMAVCTIKCDYLLKTLEEIFLSVGGDENWLIYGLENVPEKIKKLGKINNILAHQPWKLLSSDIMNLHKSENANENWNFNEFIHAAIILVTFHKLAAISESLDLSVRSQNDLCQNLNSSDKNSNCVLEVIKIEKEKSKSILQFLEIYNQEEEKNEKGKLSSSKHNDSDSEDEVLPINTSRKQTDVKLFEKHINNFCTLYLDFDPRSDDVMSYVDFNWSDNTFDILKKFYSQGIDVINDEIEYILNLTANAIGIENKQTNTSMIRRSMCCYVEKIMGYDNDDFDYSKVNKLVSIQQKKFIKNVVCFPQMITNVDFGIMGVNYTPEEIVHIILLALIVKNRLKMTFLASKVYEVWKKIDQ